MAGYVRQSNYTDGDVIQASDSNIEFDALVETFNTTIGHRHNGTDAEGPVLGMIGNPGPNIPLDKIEVSDTQIGIYINVDGTSVEQLIVKNNVMYPSDTSFDIGSSVNKFKDGYFAGTVTVDRLVVKEIDGQGSFEPTFDAIDINGGTIDGTTIGSEVSDSGTFTDLTSSSFSTTSDSDIFNLTLGRGGTGASNTNVVFGHSTGASLTLGTNSTAVGSYALFKNTVGYNNTAIGYSALKTPSSGWENTAIGTNALMNSSQSIGNTALGYNALKDSITSQYNTAVGHFAGKNVTGSQNTIIGCFTGTLDSNNKQAVISLGDSTIAFHYDGEADTSLIKGTLSVSDLNIANSLNIGQGITVEGDIEAVNITLSDTMTANKAVVSTSLTAGSIVSTGSLTASSANITNAISCDSIGANSVETSSLLAGSATVTNGISSKTLVTEAITAEDITLSNNVNAVNANISSNVSAGSVDVTGILTASSANITNTISCDSIGANSVETTGLLAGSATVTNGISSKTLVTETIAADDVTLSNNINAVNANIASSVSTGSLSVTNTTDTKALDVFNLTDTGTLVVGSSVTIDAILDEDNMVSNSDTAVPTQQSVKTYVDSKVGSSDALHEVLVNGNQTLGESIDVTAGDDINLSNTSKINLGDEGYLSIHDDGVNSKITQTGVGSLLVSSNRAIFSTSGNAVASFNTDGSADLYHVGSKRLSTTVAGVQVEGVLGSDGLDIDGFVVPSADDTHDLGTETLRWKDLYLSGKLHIDLGEIVTPDALPISKGGTGGKTEEEARTNIDVDVAGTALVMAIALG